MLFCFFFFFNDTATTEIYTLSLHDALPISSTHSAAWVTACASPARPARPPRDPDTWNEIAIRHLVRCAGTPQPPGRTPQRSPARLRHSAGLRASGTTRPQAPLRCPGGETLLVPGASPRTP